MPWSSTWARVSSRYSIPFNAQLLVTAANAALGCIYLGSSTAFNAMLGSTVAINNIAYYIPFLTNMLTRRRNMYQGAFHMGNWGWLVNGVTICWLTFAIVFFSFPYAKPVTVEAMDYTCVVVGSLPILIIGWWFWAGKSYKEKIAVAKQE